MARAGATCAWRRERPGARTALGGARWRHGRGEVATKVAAEASRWSCGCAGGGAEGSRRVAVAHRGRRGWRSGKKEVAHGEESATERRKYKGLKRKAARQGKFPNWARFKKQAKKSKDSNFLKFWVVSFVSLVHVLKYGGCR